MMHRLCLAAVLVSAVLSTQNQRISRDDDEESDSMNFTTFQNDHKEKELSQAFAQSPLQVRNDQTLLMAVAKMYDTELYDCKFVKDFSGKESLRFVHRETGISVCRYFVMGTCTKGPRCTFIHDVNDIRSAPLMPKNFAKYLIKAGINPMMYKTSLCPNIKATGHCLRGSICMFAHSNTELRKPTDVYVDSDTSVTDALGSNAGHSEMFYDKCQYVSANGRLLLTPSPVGSSPAKFSNETVFSFGSPVHKAEKLSILTVDEDIKCKFDCLNGRNVNAAEFMPSFSLSFDVWAQYSLERGDGQMLCPSIDDSGVQVLQDNQPQNHLHTKSVSRNDINPWDRVAQCEKTVAPRNAHTNHGKTFVDVLETSFESALADIGISFDAMAFEDLNSNQRCCCTAFDFSVDPSLRLD